MKLLIFSLIFFSLSSNLYSLNEKVEFYITCEVVDQEVMSIKDGQSKRFSGIEDGLKAGEVFNIGFSFSAWKDPQSYNFEVYVDRLFGKTQMNSDNLDMALVSTEGQINHRSGLDRTIFSKDLILLEDIYGQVVLRRYYMNDWQLTYNRNIVYDNVGHLLNANCMSVTDRYNTMVNRMLEIYEGN